MLDFPASPATGQTYTGPNSAVWQYDGAKWNAGATAQAQNNNVGRNLLHNPLYAVAQRGAGPWTATGNYTADRWYMGFIGGTLSVTTGTMNDTNRSQIGDDAAAFHLVSTVAGGAGASDESYVGQRIESVRRTAGKTVTVSFWAACTSGTPKLAVMLFQLFGTGGSPSAPTVTTASPITLSTTYTRYTLTYALPSVTGKTFGTNGNDYLELRFGLSAGASQTAYGGIGQQSFVLALWGIQLEIGSVATPLEKPDPQADLANCQRFYQPGSIISGAYAPSGTAVWASQGPLVTMRAVPTSTILSNTSAGLTGLTITSDTQKTFLGATTSATGGYVFNVGYSLSADL